MKKALTTSILLILTVTGYSQQLTIFYYGATDCGPCNRPEVIESINTLKADFDSLHTGYDTKFVLVAIDETVAQGLKLIEKYDPWDEVALGSRYHNELALDNLNGAEIPGLPHIFIYRDTFEDAGYGIEIRKDRALVQEVLGGDGIVAWVRDGMKLD